ncbi:LLM class flavin-dependent oxidoreductase [Streptomyces avicenniae]|uniref:LLM class flavin-dependent oxidoreductase n=1 Tax=Streptomyces avicenniae TaxID=500153 RepID=UPI00069C3E7A|nr:LLM class flavin-dependent oxidoreductase [Streptomyces avicenniae]
MTVEDARPGRLSFGIKTTPAHVGYEDVLRVWQEADGVPSIEHAWLWDHLLPMFGPADGPVLEGWTLLSALAARTERLGLGLLVSGNRVRPPALLAKMAATVDAIAGGRLTVGLGVGATLRPDGSSGVPAKNGSVDEYAAYGITPVRPAEGVARLAEACVILRRLWTEERVDFDGAYYRLAGGHCEPRPARHVPLLVGGTGTRTLRVAAEHADLWNAPGPPHHDVAFLRERIAVLDRHCADIGRPPQDITRSVQTHVFWADPGRTRATVRELVAAGFDHIVLSLTLPLPPSAAHRVAEEIIEPVLAEARVPARTG